MFLRAHVYSHKIVAMIISKHKLFDPNGFSWKVAYCFLLFLGSLFLYSCKEKEVEYSNNNCKVSPPFINKLGFNPANSYLSTSDGQKIGLVLTEAVDPNNLAMGSTRTYQDSSWKMAGWLAPIQIDDKGNVFVAPVPFINVLHNPARQQNTLYKLEGQTGKMAPFINLPLPDSINSNNPFGIIGLAYLCESNTLYISTVATSNRQAEHGAIYEVDAATAKITGKITDIDVLGMGIAYTDGHRKLYFGKARNPAIYSVMLNKDGSFSGRPQPEFTLEGLGPRGDDKVRRIRLDKDGSLLVYGMEFNFNLIAPREKQEMLYHFVYNEEERKWMYAP